MNFQAVRSSATAAAAAAAAAAAVSVKINEMKDEIYESIHSDAQSLKVSIVGFDFPTIFLSLFPSTSEEEGEEECKEEEEEMT